MENQSESTMIRLTLLLIPNAFDSFSLNSLLEQLVSCANSLERANTVTLSNTENQNEKKTMSTWCDKPSACTGRNLSNLSQDRVNLVLLALWRRNAQISCFQIKFGRVASLSARRRLIIKSYH